MEITVLSGGTGTPKLLSGFRELDSFPNEALTVVANTADDVMISGNLVCPDLDTVMYTMAERIDEETWFGIEGDTYKTHNEIQSLSHSEPRGAYLPDEKQTEGPTLSHWRRFSGYHEFMKIGDLDRATHVTRSALLEEGTDLTGATEFLTESMGIEASVLPMSNDPVATIIDTGDEVMHFQEYLLGRGGEPTVESFDFRGADGARPTGAVRESLNNPVIIGPSNPVTSIGPILSLPGVRQLLNDTIVIVVSPFVNDRVFSGPAREFMEAIDHEPSTEGALSFYEPITDAVILDNEDVTDTNIHTVRTNTDMSDESTAVELADTIMGVLDKITEPKL